MSKLIHLTRHAQSEFNAYGGNTLDCGITEKGQEQARTQLVGGNYDLVIVSTLKRTRLTLKNSQLTYRDWIVLDICREMKDSHCDYLPGELMEKKETKEEVTGRVKQFKIKLLELSQNYSRILVICHGVFGWYLTGHLLHNCELMDITSFIIPEPQFAQEPKEEKEEKEIEELE